MSNHRDVLHPESIRAERVRFRAVCGVAAVSAAVALAGCGGGDDVVALDPGVTPATETPPTPPPTPAPTNAPAETGPPPEPDVDAVDEEPVAAAPASTSAPSAATGGDPECLIGTWAITEDEMNAYYSVLARNIGPAELDLDLGFDLDVTGEVTLDLDGSGYEYVADFGVTMAVAGLEGEGASTGGSSGTYTVEDGVIRTELASSDLAVTIDVGGTEMDAGDLTGGLLTDVPIDGAPYGCDGPTLSLPAGLDPSIRHDVVLTSR